MVDNKTSGLIVIWITIVAGMVLVVVPMPQFVPVEIGFLRPDWVVMVLVYWIIALPHRVGIPTAWLVGIAMDILLGSLIGQHALTYVLIAYVTVSLYQRLRMFSVWQQATILFALLGLNQLIGFSIESIAGLTDWSLWYLLPALSGAFLWPWIFLMLRFMRRTIGVT
ncbi:MAG: rod shape-determining protein MreD [Candidatus Azotimanducaceae bacterium WSBS_2022_MAG_OTU7]